MCGHVCQTGAITVGDLRKLTDPEWKTLDIPAICRVYLKYVVRQSSTLAVAWSSDYSVQRVGCLTDGPILIIVRAVRTTPGGPKTFIQELQDDFNFGACAFQMPLLLDPITYSSACCCVPAGQPFDYPQYDTNLQSLMAMGFNHDEAMDCLLYTSPSPRD